LKLSFQCCFLTLCLANSRGNLKSFCGTVGTVIVLHHCVVCAYMGGREGGREGGGVNAISSDLTSFLSYVYFLPVSSKLLSCIPHTHTHTPISGNVCMCVFVFVCTVFCWPGTPHQGSHVASSISDSIWTTKLRWSTGRWAGARSDMTWGWNWIAQED